MSRPALTAAEAAFDRFGAALARHRGALLLALVLSAVAIVGTAAVGFNTAWLPTDDHNAVADWRFWAANACMLWALGGLLLFVADTSTKLRRQ